MLNECVFHRFEFSRARAFRSVLKDIQFKNTKFQLDGVYLIDNKSYNILVFIVLS